MDNKMCRSWGELFSCGRGDPRAGSTAQDRRLRGRGEYAWRRRGVRSRRVSKSKRVVGAVCVVCCVCGVLCVWCGLFGGSGSRSE